MTELSEESKQWHREFKAKRDAQAKAAWDSSTPEQRAEYAALWEEAKSHPHEFMTWLVTSARSEGAEFKAFMAKLQPEFDAYCDERKTVLWGFLSFLEGSDDAYPIGRLCKEFGLSVIDAGSLLCLEPELRARLKLDDKPLP